MKLITAAVVILVLALTAAGQPTCGRQAGGALCPNVRCCSIWGYCSDTANYCGSCCQLSCWSGERSDHRCGSALRPVPLLQPLGLLQRRLWLLQRRQLPVPVHQRLLCRARRRLAGQRHGCLCQRCHNRVCLHFLGNEVNFLTNKLLLVLVRVCDNISNTINVEKGSELEAPYKWGLCHINTTAYDTDFCTSSDWPCASGKKYSPRGAMQLSHNFNYGVAGQALGLDLIMEPELVAVNPVVSFKTAMWFWMTRHENKPSCHEIVLNANSGTVGIQRNGVIGNIIARALGHKIGGTSSIGFYKRYCDMMRVSYGHNLKFWLDNVPSSLIQMPAVA